MPSGKRVEEAGAQCLLISGPTDLQTPHKFSRINVETAQQMYDAVMMNIKDCDLFIATAAVSDYRPQQPSQQKIKKSQQHLILELTRNPEVSKQYPEIFSVGFAAETQDLAQSAIQKLNQKSLNMVIANNVARNDIGFDSGENEVTAFWQGGEQTFEKASKSRIARQLIQLIAEKFAASR